MNKDIQDAADLVNSLLQSKGLVNEPLKFHTINSDINNYENDKSIINTIYKLIQDVDKSKVERFNLKQKIDLQKLELSASKDDYSKLVDKYDQVVNTSQIISNKVDLLQKDLKLKEIEKAKTQKLYQLERNINSSLKVKYDVDMKRQNNVINSIKDKLIKKKLELEVNSVDHDVIDNELEKMMVNLGKLINNLTIQNSQMLVFFQYIKESIELIQESFKNGKVLQLKEYDDINGNDDDINNNLSNLAKFDQFKQELISSLKELISINQFNNKNEQYEREVVKLRNDLEKALELNEKWKKKWDEK